MPRTVTAIFLGLLALGGRTAGGDESRPPDEAAGRTGEILAQLRRRDDPAQVAWGAWRAGEAGLTLAVGLVRARLADEARSPTPEVGWCLTAVLLDAALKLRLLPPPDVLLAHADGHVDAVVTICATFGAPDSVLLALYDRFDSSGGNDVPWLAVGNLLHARGAPGFARRVLARWTKRCLLRVWDREGPYAPWRGPSDSVPGDGIAKTPPDFPPIPRYELEQDDRDGQYPLVAPGLRPVHVATWHDDPGGWMGWSFNVGDIVAPSRDAVREEWLDAWRHEPVRPGAPRPDPPPQRIDDDLEIHDLRYTGHQPWVRETTAWIRALHARYWSCVSDLIARGLLEEAEARTLAPTLDIEVRDERTHRRRPLPPLPTVAPENAWAQPP